MNTFETIDLCPACDSRYAQIIANFDWHRRVTPILGCRSCGHRWLPFAEDVQNEVETEVYTESYLGYRDDTAFSDTMRREIGTSFVKRIPKGRVLDVGCGNGAFLRCAKEAGYSVSGCEVSKAAVQMCLNQEIYAVAADFSTHVFADTYDFITMWDVMEHLRCPGDFIRRSMELLNDGGYLVLKIPMFPRLNFAFIRLRPSLARILLGAPDHCQYYSEDSLKRLLRRHGFSRIDFTKRGPFRGAPNGGTIRRKLARKLATGVRKMAGNYNAYVFAQKSGLSTI